MLFIFFFITFHFLKHLICICNNSAIIHLSFRNRFSILSSSKMCLGQRKHWMKKATSLVNYQQACHFLDLFHLRTELGFTDSSPPFLWIIVLRVALKLSLSRTTVVAFPSCCQWNWCSDLKVASWGFPDAEVVTLLLFPVNPRESPLDPLGRWRVTKSSCDVSTGSR